MVAAPSRRGVARRPCLSVCLPVCPFVSGSVWLRLGLLVPQAVRQAESQWKSQGGVTDRSNIVTSTPRSACTSVEDYVCHHRLRRLDQRNSRPQPAQRLTFISTCAQVSNNSTTKKTPKTKQNCNLQLVSTPPLSVLFTVLSLQSQNDFPRIAIDLPGEVAFKNKRGFDASVLSPTTEKNSLYATVLTSYHTRWWINFNLSVWQLN